MGAMYEGHPGHSRGAGGSSGAQCSPAMPHGRYPHDTTQQPTAWAWLIRQSDAKGEGDVRGNNDRPSTSLPLPDYLRRVNSHEPPAASHPCRITRPPSSATLAPPPALATNLKSCLTPCPFAGTVTAAEAGKYPGAETLIVQLPGAKGLL
jgi:hypothetical protein